MTDSPRVYIATMIFEPKDYKNLKDNIILAVGRKCADMVRVSELEHIVGRVENELIIRGSEYDYIIVQLEYRYKREITYVDGGDCKVYGWQYDRGASKMVNGKLVTINTDKYHGVTVINGTSPYG